ncbi:MAG TPA: hypothetical protein VE693_02790, partial [Gaiellaceae bacterium]|nr:hypothetical protein [Gaiellaceae bacterium]
PPAKGHREVSSLPPSRVRTHDLKPQKPVHPTHPTNGHHRGQTKTRKPPRHLSHQPPPPPPPPPPHGKGKGTGAHGNANR